VLLAAATVPLFPTTFLPPFNEGSAMVGLRLNPGTTLAETTRIGAAAETSLRAVPEVEHVGRRSGRAELDEHAEGVHVSELDVKLRRSERSAQEVYADLRRHVASLPAAVGIGQPISHRIDHMLSGVRTQIAVKIYGDDLDTLRGQAEALRQRLAAIPGVVDLEVEKQVLTPQIRVRVDYDRALGYGIAPAKLLRELRMMIDGEKVTQIIEGSRRFNLVLRLPESARGMEGLRNLFIDTPGGRVPLSQLATVEESDGPNQISRDDGRRRIVISANAQGRALSDVVDDIRAASAATKLPEGYFVTIGGQFQAQEDASRLIGLLSLASLVLIFLILFSRYRSGRAGHHHHGQHPAGAGRRRRRPVAVGPAALGGGAGGLHHAGRHRDPQRHHEGIALREPVRVRRRDLLRPHAGARLAGAPHAGADDGAGGGSSRSRRCCSRPTSRAPSC
jgi:HME family heavy-metal exporter